MEKAAIINIKDGTLHIAGKALLCAISLQVHPGEIWAVVGPSGSGKSTLLNLVAGKYRLSTGEIAYNFTSPALHHNDDHLQNHPIALVSLKHQFKDVSNTTSFYYQQRYNSSDAENSTTVEDYLNNIENHALDGANWTMESVIRKLHLGHLLDRYLIQLSNGETRRIMIAAALLKHPELLLLDAPFTGLDVTTRKELNDLLQEISASGVTIIFTASARYIPAAVTHVAELNKGSLDYAGYRNEYNLTYHLNTCNTHIDVDLIRQLYLANHKQALYNYHVQMQNVSITYNQVQVLSNISWQVLPGERWSLSGPNGAGKSTLLSLINGDNPQAYANNIVLFDRRRGTGESIWDIKRNIGFISPELFQYFPSDQSCLQVIESGYYDTMGLFRSSQPAKAASAMQWMKVMKIENYAYKLFRMIPAGAQRLCLLARALVKSPPLLIMDEPCQGLDDEQQENFKQTIDVICAATTVSIIYVTHYKHELPESITHHIHLNKGCVVL